MNDLTVIYYTAGKINEHFAEKVRAQLLGAIGDTPLISLSKKPLDFGLNICDKEKESSVVNIYKAVLEGARAAKTPFIALAEDDALYSPEHFRFRPPTDTFAYDFSRWSIFSWTEPPCFCLKLRRILATLIAPRELLIKNIEGRFENFPDSSKIPLQYMVEPGRSLEGRLGITPSKAMEYWAKVPSVVFSHEEALGFAGLGKKKALEPIRAFEIPYWGRASDIVKLYREHA
jgi:hypothetical protein